MAADLIAGDWPAAPRQSAGHAPLRRPASVRRTSSIDVTWPGGYEAPMQFEGRARDLLTDADGRGRTLASARLLAELAGDRTIRSLTAEPPRTGLEQLVGCRGGGYLREAIDTALPGEREAGTPLYLLLDDLSGTSLIARWAWSHWNPDWLRREFAGASAEQMLEHRRARMENICTGFRTGSSALSADVEVTDHSQARVVPLPNPADPDGWHALPDNREVALRRSRRVDVWLEDVVRIDAMFQDSATLPDGGRAAIHEYTLTATADPVTFELLSVTPQPRILPWPECPSAVPPTAALLGTPLGELRATVLEVLRRERGCTHLNDALRALAEVPLLVAALAAQ